MGTPVLKPVSIFKSKGIYWRIQPLILPFLHPIKNNQGMYVCKTIKGSLNLMGSDMSGPEGIAKGNNITLSLNCWMLNYEKKARNHDNLIIK